MSQDEKKEKCQTMVDDITKAADFPHDIFVGLRLFASTMSKAIDMEDKDKQIEALDKALSFEDKFVKALGRLKSKVANHQKMLVQQAEAMAKAKAEQEKRQQNKQQHRQEVTMMT